MFLFLGISINIPTDNDLDTITQEKLKEFEDEIIVKDNDYENTFAEITPNVCNNIGNKVEDIIDKGFGYVFKMVKGLVNEK